MLFDIVLDTIWSSNLVHFWSQVGPKLDQKLIKKPMQKYDRFWNRFLIDFGPTWLQFWTQLGPKLDLNRCTFGTILEQMFKKSQDRPKYANLASTWRHFGLILVSFWVQIGSNLMPKSAQTHIHTYIDTYIHTYMHAYIQTYVYMCACVYEYIRYICISKMEKDMWKFI